MKTLKEIKDKKFIRLKYQRQQPYQQPTERDTQIGGQHSSTQNGYHNQNQNITNRNRIARQDSRTIMNGYRAPSRQTSRTNTRWNKQAAKKGSQTNDYENKINDLDRQLNELREVKNQNQTSTYSQVVQNNKAINILTTITNRTLQRETSCRLIPNNKKTRSPATRHNGEQRTTTTFK